ncbi:six-hairpin glycosidase-like protein [Neolewinella aurantiaca]|uniref:Six-hairpin glycosidase-like protein n=1 Tax=Neolewinella aurantiaca TaxID=2602767 RepID=A0A5C7FBW5_9BACT|nr:six-hairpin glycosidase-like protein [Neolewinella aurantiaca]TXF87623.1 six-hairpin glycosidase-like protein [Neolewinella aurantiaca]
MRYLVFLILSSMFFPPIGQETRWQINESESGIVWDVANDTRLPHGDNIEMSGRGVSAIIHYAVDTNRMVKVKRELIFPQMRPYIKDADPAWWATYRNYLRQDYEDEEVLPRMYVGSKEVSLGPVEKIVIDGTLSIFHEPDSDGLQISRTYYPAQNMHAAFERIEFSNVGEKVIRLKLDGRYLAESRRGEEGRWTINSQYVGKIEKSLVPGERDTVFLVQEVVDAKDRTILINSTGARLSHKLRKQQISDLQENLILETPNPTYNTMFSLAKIRGAESIFDSKLGLVHSPGGGRYYIGFWANDQAEYINPFFPYLGYQLGNDAALNMWRIYRKAIPEDGSNIRYSFEMEGDSPANPLDRGDAAMIAYGLSHYLLALGDQAIAEELWPLLNWCLDYNHRMLTEDGVVASQSDEMEGRIETGDANLSTSSLYYGALETSISLARELGKDKKMIKTWSRQREALSEAIENFFGREVEGLETYRYYDGHEALRHWIALPLVVGLRGREEGTLTGLFDRLWTENGVAVEKNHPNPAVSKIFWDRGTLYALRGAFIAGGVQRAHERLLQYSQERLLGERVPYAVEAYPEGNMAHLSAESGLYCRVFTEGLFGILPTGFRSFRLQPRMPEGWDKMALRNIHALGQDDGFDIEVSRKGQNMTVVIKDSNGEVLSTGDMYTDDTMTVRLPE